ncbi:hypothetical protein [Streptomyces yangpuensis]|uniref:hypothetical protein n=1 Tax=Streptomyces yangpuensis TaxID=1648182 RepID=UPI0036626DF2
MTLTFTAENSAAAPDLPALALRARLNDMLHRRGWVPGIDVILLLQQIEHQRTGLPVIPDWSRIDTNWAWEDSVLCREAEEESVSCPTLVRVHEDTIDVSYAYPDEVAVDTWCELHRPAEMTLPFTDVGIDVLARLLPAVEMYTIDNSLVAACVGSGLGCGTVERPAGADAVRPEH